MCEHGDTVSLMGVGVDACIVELVAALNAGGIRTVASCCGHGKRPGNIALADGRELVICPDYETARIAEKAFPPISPHCGTCGDAGTVPIEEGAPDTIVATMPCPDCDPRGK